MVPGIVTGWQFVLTRSWALTTWGSIVKLPCRSWTYGYLLRSCSGNPSNFVLGSVSLQNGVSILVSIASTADQRMEVDYIFEQNATLQEMQHQKIMATAKLCAEYDVRLVKNTRN